MDDFWRYQNRRRRGPKRPDLLADKILDLTNIGAGILIFSKLDNLSLSSFFQMMIIVPIAFYLYWYTLYRL